MPYLYLTFLIAFVPSFSSASPEAKTLLQNWKDAMYTPAETSKMKMTIKRAGEDDVVREAEVLYKGEKDKEAKFYLRFLSPAKIKGTSFLSLKKSSVDNSDQWIYFPAYKKSRRLSSRKKSDSFLDSDFNNGDISFEYHQDFAFKVIREDKLDGKDVYVLEGVAPAEADTPYSKQVLYISKSDNLNLQTDFYDKKGQLIKKLKVEKWTKYGDHWAIDDGVMQDLVNKGETRIQFLTRDTKNVPSDKNFTLVYLERGQ